MKKNLFITAFVLFTAVSFAQNTVSGGNLEVGNFQVNGGVGFSNWGVPIYAGIEYGVHEDVTVGGELSYRKKSEDSADYTSFAIIANGNYHFNRILNIPSEFDVYAGVSIGYFNWSVENAPVGYSKAYSSGLGSYLQIGGRYFINDQIGLNLELGGGNVSGGKFGITYRF